MSKPADNWEVHWQETLANHEAGPPSATDWGGMEQLLDAKVVAIQPKPATGQFPSPASLPWSVWAIVLVSLLALGYWLGTRTAGVIGQENQPSPNERVATDVTNTVPASDAAGKTLPSPPANSNRTAENLPAKKDQNYSSPKPGPAINTPAPAGGQSDDAPPAALAPIEEGTPAKFAPPRPTPEGISPGFEEQNTAPALPPPSATRRRADLKYRNVRSLKTLTTPTDHDHWEQRVDELLQSGKLVIIPPSRIDNGHFPAYRRWN